MADIAGFLKKVGNKVEEAANKTAKTAGDLTQKGKYKVEINKYRGEIKTIQSDLGKNIIEAKFQGQGNIEVLDLVAEAYAKIEELNAEIERVEVLISEVGQEDVEDTVDFVVEDFVEVKEEAEEKVENLKHELEDAKDVAEDHVEDLKEKAEEKVEEIKDNL